MLHLLHLMHNISVGTQNFLLFYAYMSHLCSYTVILEEEESRLDVICRPNTQLHHIFANHF